MVSAHATSVSLPQLDSGIDTIVVKNTVTGIVTIVDEKPPEESSLRRTQSAPYDPRASGYACTAPPIADESSDSQNAPEETPEASEASGQEMSEDTPEARRAKAMSSFKQCMCEERKKLLRYPAPDACLQAGSILYVVRPPADSAAEGEQLEDRDVEVLADTELFTKRLGEMVENDEASEAQFVETTRRFNRRQKDALSITKAKVDKADKLREVFHVEHIPQDQLIHELRHIHGVLSTIAKNRAVNAMGKALSISEKSKLAMSTFEIVFKEVSLFLDKIHNHPDCRRSDFVSKVRSFKDDYVDAVIDWVEAKPLLQYLHEGSRVVLETSETSRVLADCFSETLTKVCRDAPQERRRYLRRSMHHVSCWKIQIPNSVANCYLGDAGTVNQQLSGQDEVEWRRCINFGRDKQMTILLLETKEGKYDCRPGPTKKLPPNGFVYTLCQKCRFRENNDQPCHCTTWLKKAFKAENFADSEALAKARKNQTRMQLPMDELLCGEHLHGYIVGRTQDTPEKKYDDKDLQDPGALNLRQFTHGRVNVVALALPLKEKAP